MQKAARAIRAQRDENIVGVRAYAAISAVEDLRLSPAGKARLSALANGNLTQDEKRERIVQAYKERKTRER